MSYFLRKKTGAFVIMLLAFSTKISAHEIYFCNEAIPTSRDFVAHKLMNVIKDQIPNVTLATLRYKARIYFPYISAWLKYSSVQDVFKVNDSRDDGLSGFVPQGDASR